MRGLGQVSAGRKEAKLFGGGARSQTPASQREKPGGANGIDAEPPQIQDVSQHDRAPYRHQRARCPRTDARHP